MNINIKPDKLLLFLVTITLLTGAVFSYYNFEEIKELKETYKQEIEENLINDMINSATTGQKQIPTSNPNVVLIYGLVDITKEAEWASNMH